MWLSTAKKKKQTEQGTAWHLGSWTHETVQAFITSPRELLQTAIPPPQEG